jgi:hypothetical protein
MENKDILWSTYFIKLRSIYILEDYKCVKRSNRIEKL